MKRAGIALLIVIGIIAVVAVWWLQPDPYTDFVAKHMAATDPGNVSRKLPLTASWPMTGEGVGPIRFSAQPSDIVHAMGKPRSVVTFPGESNDTDFALAVSNSQFSFARGRLYRAYLQLTDFPGLTLGGTAVTSLNRSRFKDLGFEIVSEGRQDVTVRFSESVFVTIGFVADTGAPTGRSFYLSFDQKPSNKR